MQNILIPIESALKMQEDRLAASQGLSAALGYEVKTCFDANYGKVNSYNQRVFELL